MSESDSYFGDNDTSIFYQDKDIHKIEDVLNKEILTLCKWFIGNNLLIHFGKDKTKFILCSLMQPHFDHGCTSWFHFSRKTLNISFRQDKTNVYALLRLILEKYIYSQFLSELDLALQLLFLKAKQNSIKY